MVAACPSASGHRDDLGGADLDFGGLSVRGSCGDALTVEQELDRQTELACRIREQCAAAVLRRESGHLPVQPDQQRPALAKRSRLAVPMYRVIAGGCRLAHAPA